MRVVLRDDEHAHVRVLVPAKLAALAAIDPRLVCFDANHIGHAGDEVLFAVQHGALERT